MEFSEFFSGLLSFLPAYISWETAGVVAAIAYVVLAARENIWCWLFALISTMIFIVVFWDVSLLMESALNAYYLAMAIYGWMLWRKTPSDDSGSDNAIQIHRWPLKYHVFAIVAVVVISAINGWLLTLFSHASLPYLDSLTTWAAVLATWMMARKVLVNWIYWIVIDAISIYLYLSKELYQITILFVFYILIAGYGWFVWRKKIKMEAEAQNNTARTIRQ